MVLNSDNETINNVVKIVGGMISNAAIDSGYHSPINREYNTAPGYLNVVTKLSSEGEEGNVELCIKFENNVWSVFFNRKLTHSFKHDITEADLKTAFNLYRSSAN